MARQGVNPAKRILGGFIMVGVILIVAAFLAMHSINLFTYIFPPDQQQWAWLGFGLTGIGAVGYLVDFKWLAKTYLQKVIAVSMTVICIIGEVLAAIFGIMIESWKKSGFAFTEQDAQNMLMVIGLLAVLHLFALMGSLGGDAVLALFGDGAVAQYGDHDRDGVRNADDPDSAHFAPPPPRAHSGNGNSPPPLRHYNMNELLALLKMTPDEFRQVVLDAGSTGHAWNNLSRDLPLDIGYNNFRAICASVNPPVGANQNRQ